MEGGDGSEAPSASPAGEAKMGVAKKEDVLLLTDEKFDFDLSLSSSSANEDDEVFFGPVGHKERCIAASLELNDRIPVPASAQTWSPLTGEKFVEVYREAHLLALQIESQSRKQAAQAAKPENAWSQGMERFVQESQLKMNLFEKEQEMEKSPRSLKRETYYLLDSPLMGPPLSGVQPPLGEPLLPAFSPALPSAPAPASPAPTQGPPHLAQPLPGQPGTAHPPNQAVPLKRITSKLQPPRASAVRGKHLHLAAEKPKNEEPASPSRMKLLNGKESHRDVLSDKPSAALGAAGLPVDRSQLGQGKRSLPIPSKLGLKKTLLKPPGYPGPLTRKSSSSGSASSLASSVCASPASGKAKSGELAHIPASSSQLLSSTSKSGRTGPAVLRQPLPAAPAGPSCRRAGGADAAPLPVARLKAPTTAPLTQPHTPEREGPGLDPDSFSSTSQLNKIGSVRRRESCLNSTTKVASTPTNPFKIPRFSVGGSPSGFTPRSSQVQRLQSRASAGRATVPSTPVRRSSGPASQSLAGSMRTPVSARRASALPTPAGRRLSGLLLMTPQSVPRALAAPLCVPARRLSSEPQKKSAVRTGLTQESGRRAGYGQAGLGLSPNWSSSPPPSVPLALCFSPEKSDFPLSEDSTTGAQDEAKPCEEARPGVALLIDLGLDQLSITPEADGSAPADHPLIDFSSTPEAHVALGPDSRPLIDLTTNTPEVDRNGALKPLQAERQLIDLGSPLIQLSPEADKENVDSPLLKF